MLLIEPNHTPKAHLVISIPWGLEIQQTNILDIWIDIQCITLGIEILQTAGLQIWETSTLLMASSLGRGVSSRQTWEVAPSRRGSCFLEEQGEEFIEQENVGFVNFTWKKFIPA